MTAELAMTHTRMSWAVGVVHLPKSAVNLTESVSCKVPRVTANWTVKIKWMKLIVSS